MLRPFRSAAGVAFAVLLSGTCGDADSPAGPTPPSSALRFAELSAGYYHTCGLTASGAAFCWGANDFGTLGDGTRTLRTQATAVAGGRIFASLDAGAGHNCALTRSGAAWCWGQNDEGQLGDGSFIPRDRPVAVAGNLIFVQVSAGHAHSCGVTGDGSAYCWGDDTRGELGNGVDDNTESSSPVRVQSTDSFARVFAGYYQTCALTTAGAARCWGRNDFGQLGDGGGEDGHVPVAVSGGRTFTDLAPGDRFVCGVSDGASWCWGANRNGELGAPAPAGGSSVPVRIEDAPSAARIFTSMGTSTISSAQPYGCLVRGNGAGLCWGGAIRSLRDVDAGLTTLDARIRFTVIATGAQHICGLSLAGYAYCGGGNYAGQIGDGTRTDRTQLIPIPGPLHP